MLLKTTPFKHQADVIELSKDRPYYGLFMEQGTGKTLVGIANFTHLFRKGEINGVIIVGPNGVHDNWTRIEIPKHCILDENREYHVATWHGNDGARKKKRWDWVANQAPTTELVVLACNVEALRTESFWKTIEKGFLKERSFMLIVDESTIIKNPKAEQSKNCFHLAEKAKYTRIMTGTPITQSPLDLWSQCRVLSKDALPYTSYTAFKHEFAIEQAMVFGNRRFNKIVAYRNQELLAQLIAPFTYRVLKKDCLDLPPKVYQTRFVELTAEQRRVYTDLSQQCLATLGDGKGVATVTTVITMLLRLHQVVLGYVPNDNPKEMVRIEHNRIKALWGLLEENAGKAIIYCRFLEDVKQVSEMLDARLNEEESYALYTGDESSKDRTESVDRFQADPKCLYFVATSAASRGLTLTAAEQVIYYSQGYSLETRLQSEDRAHRSGQTKTVVYTDFCSQGTVEDAIVQALQSKKELAAGVMDHAALARLIKLDE